MMINTKSCSESETKSPGAMMSPLHSVLWKMYAYGLPIEQHVGTICYCEQAFQESFFFFAAVLDCHGELELTMPVGKPLGIVNSLLHPKLWLS